MYLSRFEWNDYRVEHIASHEGVPNVLLLEHIEASTQTH